MQQRLGVLLQATSRLAQEIDFLKTMLFGHDQILKRLNEYESIIEELKKEAEAINEQGSTDIVGDNGTHEVREVSTEQGEKGNLEGIS